MPTTQRESRHIIARGILSACVLLAFCSAAFALNPTLDVSQYAHTSWKIRDGFAPGHITAIAQTPDGYLWLGTEFGLLRFDGVKAHPFQLPGNQASFSGTIFQLLVARDGTLWIASDKGLSSWNGRQLTQYSELAGQFVFSVVEDRDGTIWAGSLSIPKGRLCAVRSVGVQCFGQDGELGRGVMTLYEDSQQNFWVVVPNGLWHWKPGPPKFFSLPDTSVRNQRVVEDSDGALLLATDDGIKRFVSGKTETFRLPGIATQQFRVNNMMRDRDGGLWLGTSSQLVHVHQDRTDLFSLSDGLSGEGPGAMFEDREGNVWVATISGLDRFRDLAIPTFSEKQLLSKRFLYSALATNDGSVLFVSDGGLSRWNSGLIVPYGRNSARSQDRANLPRSLFQDSRGRIWAVSEQKFGYLENDQFITLSGIPGGVVRSIAEDKEGNLWVANQNLGLFQLRDGQVVQRVSWETLGHKDFGAALAIDHLRGGLWVGFFGGGVAYFKDGQVQVSYTAADGLGAGRIDDLQFDPKGSLWVATQGGLSRVKDNRIATLTQTNGLPCDQIHWMKQDDVGAIWLNTSCGLVRIPRAELDTWAAAADQRTNVRQGIQLTVFDTSDGVISRSYPSGFYPQVTKSADGKLWFTVEDGISVIDPRHLPFNKLAPPVHVDQIVADRKTYEAGGQIRLPALIRDLQIDYTALSLVAPEKIRFRYKLEGYDSDWQDVGNRRQAFYTNLPPRNYRFRVMACNNSGVWNEAGTFLDFTIAPAYYQSTWFRLLLLAALLTVLALVHQLRLRQVARQFSVRMEERVAERTRIARDLHDTLLQSFQGVLLKFHAVTYLLPHRADEAQKKLHDVIEQAEQAINEGRDAVQGLRSSTVVTNELAQAITTLGEELVADQTEHPPEFRVIVEGTSREMVPLVRDEVYRIASEALHNAFRHAQAGRIEVEILYDRRRFQLRVRDNGKGIEPKVLAEGAQSGHYGLAGMHERAKLVRGELTVLSRDNSGTEIELVIPGFAAYAKSQVGRRPLFAGKGS